MQNDKQDEELTDKRVMEDIRRSIRRRNQLQGESPGPEPMTEEEIRGLAVRGVEQYWEERDKAQSVPDDDSA